MPAGKNNKNKKTQTKSRRPIVWVTGLSGAGHSTALRALEDLGYQAIDNLPLAMIDALLATKSGHDMPLAIGVDTRVWDFSSTAFIALAQKYRQRRDIDFTVLFLDCADDILLQRYTETRRRHPHAEDRPVKDGIALERRMTAALHEVSDIVIDTSDVKAPDLRQILADRFGGGVDSGLYVHVVSFGFKNGLPREADMVFDARFIANPFWNPKLKPLSGLDKPVRAAVRRDKAFGPFLKTMTTMLLPLLPRYAAQGKKYLTIAIGCTGGRHRSVVAAEDLFKLLKAKGYKGTLRHRDMAEWEKKHLSTR